MGGAGGYDPDVEPGTGGEPSLERYIPCEVERIIAARCRRCHLDVPGAFEPFLETWTQVSPIADIILEVVEDDYMPLLPPPLSAEEKETLRAWVVSGAPPLTLESPPDCGRP